MPTYEITSPDGKVFEVTAPDGATQEQVLAYAQQNFSQAQSPTQPMKQEVGIGRTILDQGLQGATFGFADEVTDRIGAMIASRYTGLPYEELLKEARDTTKKRMAAEMDQNPGTSIAANIAGGLLTGGAGATTKAGSAVASGISSGGTAARVVKGGLAGATSGALYGAGAADEGQRLEGAGEGALVGGALGAAAPAVINAVTRTISGTTRKVADKATQRIAEKSGEIVPADLPNDLKKVYSRLRADFPNDDDFRFALNSYASKQGKTLLEAGGQRVANLAEGASLYPSGAAKSADFFGERVGAMPEKIKDVLAKIVSPEVNYFDTLDTLVDAGRKKAAPIYKNAFTKNQSIRSPIIDKILRTPEGQSALSEAVKNMQNEMSLVARPTPEMTALAKELADLGMMDRPIGGVASGLKLRTLDYIKKSMDSTINRAYRSGDEGEAARIINLKRALVSEIDAADKSGLYARARKVSGDYLSNKSAMDMGLDFLREDHEVVSRAFKGFGPSERRAYKVGVLKAMRNNIDNKLDGRNVSEMFQRPATRKKLQSILSEKEYQKLLGEAKASDSIYKLRNQVTGNSRTALRQIASEEFDNQSQQLVADLARNGFTRTTFDTGLKLIRRQFNGLNDKLAGEVADLLYEVDPKKKHQIVKSLVNQANLEKESLRKTEAAKKLAAFYSVADKVSAAKAPLAPVIAGQAAQ